MLSYRVTSPMDFHFRPQGSVQLLHPQTWETYQLPSCLSEANFCHEFFSDSSLNSKYRSLLSLLQEDFTSSHFETEAIRSPKLRKTRNSIQVKENIYNFTYIYNLLLLL